MCQLCNLVNVANRRQVNAAPPTALSSWGGLGTSLETATPQSFARQEPDRYDSSPRSQSPGDGSSISS